MSFKALHPVKILLVEDALSDANLMMREFQRSSLENQLYWVETGEAAIQFLYKQAEYSDVLQPDLIILDLNLPGLNGLEVLEQVKGDLQLRQIPIVILTTSSDQQDIRDSYRLSANCYITKPIEVRQFIQVVHQIIEFWFSVSCLPLD